MANVNGTNANDVIRTDKYTNNSLSGGDGNYILYSGEGDNSLYGDLGNDILDVSFSSGKNLLDGGLGNDQLYASNTTSNNSLKGGAGGDYFNINNSSGKNFLDGGSENDSFSASYTTGNNTLNGGEGNDYLYIYHSSGNNLLNGGSEDDRLYASNTSGNNTLKGGTGDDVLDISFSSGNNLLSGGLGNDQLYAYSASGNNTLKGGSDNDSFHLSAPSVTPDVLVTQTVDGGTGDDYLSIDYSSFTTEGITSTFDTVTNQGSITAGTYRVSYKNIEQLDIFGTANTDTILGSNGNDFLFGNDGNDLLTGGRGNDYLFGGEGTDTFAFNNYDEGVDSLYDFDPIAEVIQVSAAGFGGSLAESALLTSQFTIGSAATTDAQRFIYDNGTGALFFDQDGSGGTFTQVQFAQLSDGLSLSATNFVVV
ncbi:calcium-binding protein [Nostoc sp. ATCC 53789]|uniref:calcium-binding protein n=1 Tax=Nostoc sp. ATCC 53789 TaxID=76335 RepID=UPI000DED14F8|nr:calcium-binding protein [Nostoc sp. ATCC 53789]QHG17565.1 hypothetical protein GJB62_17275 [Nostoc sp. ATCC 53789]RCJ30206.1 hypothetical protein A6V25_15520 [Nostoc sp. ATCC 53789]